MVRRLIDAPDPGASTPTHPDPSFQETAMTRRTTYLLTTAIVAALTLAGCNRKTDDTMADTNPAPIATTPAPAPAPAAMPAPAPAAVTVASVTLGTAAGGDKRIAAPVSTFKPNDPIVVSVATNGAAQNVEVRGKLVYQDGQTAGEQPAMLNATGADTTVMTFTNPKAWPAGSYKAEIWVNGQMASSANFTVQ